MISRIPPRTPPQTPKKKKIKHKRNNHAPQAQVGMHLQQIESLMNDVGSFHELLPVPQQHLLAASPKNEQLSIFYCTKKEFESQLSLNFRFPNQHEKYWFKFISFTLQH